MPTLSPTTNVPWKPESVVQALSKVKGADPEALKEYIRLLVLHIDTMYSDIASTVNQLNTQLQALKTRYDAHDSHPPPA